MEKHMASEMASSFELNRIHFVWLAAAGVGTNLLFGRWLILIWLLAHTAN